DAAAAQDRAEAAALRVSAEEQRAQGRIIRAPFAGTVVVHELTRGQGVVEGMALFTLARAGTPLTISVPLASRAAMSLAPGTKADIRFETLPDVEQGARLAGIETRNGQRLARFVLENPAPQIAPGLAGRVEVTLRERRDVLLVPDPALEFRPDAVPAGNRRDSVYRLDAKGNPQRVFVTAGGSDGGKTEVFSKELHAGENVIIGWREAPTDQK
ncbi:efflux RND transporter periplasmic adaptor subunit, partial [Novosphingobium sp. 1949]|nr:efflux RND transporter periplasmic adaptor subunit [Novosphingobium organovorum]